MLDKDFNWCFNHESLYRWWLNCICIIHKSHVDESLDSDSIFSLWQKAKEWAYKIANSRNPELSYINMFREIFYNTHDHRFYLFFFIHTMLMSIKNENLEEMVSNLNKTLFEMISSLELDENSSDIESDYDYSLPDGGITETITKTKTKTDETITITKTITKTDAGTQTKTKTKTKTETDETETEENSVDVILQNYNSLNNEDFISAMRKAVDKGWIKIKDGKCEWIGPKEIYKGNSDSVLTYFIGKALNLKTDVEKVKDPATDKMKEQLTYDSRQDAINRFPKEEINSLFGKSLIISQWKQIFTVQKIQVWREVIDKFFDENKENKENNIQ